MRYDGYFVRKATRWMWGEDGETACVWLDSIGMYNTTLCQSEFVTEREWLHATKIMQAEGAWRQNEAPF
jgi:hypothetical protein